MSNRYTLKDKCIAEFIGTGMIVGGGCGTVCAAKYAKYPLGAFGIPVAFGMSVALAIYATRDVSGAHLNPAMTLSFYFNKPEICPKEIVLPYIGSQILGAAFFAGLNFLVYRRGIIALEIAEKVTRGTKGSCSIFNGAFGMVPNTELLKWPGAFLGEVGMTSA